MGGSLRVVAHWCALFRYEEHLWSLQGSELVTAVATQFEALRWRLEEGDEAPQLILVHLNRCEKA